MTIKIPEYLSVCSNYSYEYLYKEAKNCMVFDFEIKKCLKCKIGGLESGFCKECLAINLEGKCIEPV